MINNHKVSIVMTTYNGSQYIIEQLDSIYKQTVKPDEVLIFDDNSTDNTYGIIQEYIHSKHLINFQLFRNDRNLGWKRNFMQAIDKSTGDVIFTSDQDDIWKLDKIEKMTTILLNDTNIELLVANYELLNLRHSETNEIKTKDMKNDKSVEKLLIHKNFHIVQRPGCTYCFTKEMFNKAKSYWVDGFAHDRLLWTWAILHHSLYLYNDSVITFRRHENNATGFSKLNTSKKERKSVAINNSLVVEKIYNNCSERLSPEEKKIVEKYIKYESLRVELYESRSLLIWIRIVVFYFQYIYSAKSAIKDLWIAKKKE